METEGDSQQEAGSSATSSATGAPPVPTLALMRSDSQLVTIDVKNINPHLICRICNGYFRDATTITECLHTFCKSCLLKVPCPAKFFRLPCFPVHSLRDPVLWSLRVCDRSCLLSSAGVDISLS